MDAALHWLAALPPAALYIALAAAAAVENFFPPLPADTVVAFGSFLAARGQGTVLGAFLSTWIGNVGGAMTVFWLGRRFGASGLRTGLARFGGPGAVDRLLRLYGHYGIMALFLSRFLPGVRALVPPFAGAVRMPALAAFGVIAAASALWYGAVTVLAYRVGANWDELSGRIGSLSRGTAVAAAAVAALVGLLWLIRRRRAT